MELRFTVGVFGLVVFLSGVLPGEEAVPWSVCSVDFRMMRISKVSFTFFGSSLREELLGWVAVVG